MDAASPSPFPRSPCHDADLDLEANVVISRSRREASPRLLGSRRAASASTVTRGDPESTSASTATASRKAVKWQDEAAKVPDVDDSFDASNRLEKPRLVPAISRDSKSFRYNPQWRSHSNPRMKKRCCPPRLWVLLLVFFVVLMSFLTLLTMMWFFQNAGAVHKMGTVATENVDKLDEAFSEQTNKLIENLHWQSGEILSDIVTEMLRQPVTIVGLNNNLFGTASMTSAELNLDFALQWMWLQLTQQFLEVEGIGLARPTGLYMEYERDSQRAGMLGMSENGDETFTMEFAPPEHINVSGCSMFCPQEGDLEYGRTYQYFVDPETGRYIAQRENVSFNGTGRDSYLNTVRAGGELAWTGPYTTWSRPGNTTSHSIALRAGRAHMVDGVVQAVLYADITLDYLSHRLRNYSQKVHGEGGIVFIMDFDGQLVSHSGGMDEVVHFDEDGSHRFKYANESSCNLTRMVAADILRAERPVENVAMFIDGGEIIYTDKFVKSGDPQYGGLQWILVDTQRAIFYKGPIEDEINRTEDDLAEGRKRLEADLQRQVLGYSLGTWALSVILGIFTLWGISRKITMPLRQIHKDMRAFAQFDADTIDSMVVAAASKAAKRPSRCFEIREITEICDSFTYMAAGLQSFARYMDAHLVQTLVRSKRQAQLGMAPADVTIFFSDLVGFTTLAESMDTGQLMEVLGTYLEEMSDVVMDYGGVVGEFIGDAIMAWWNAPPLEYGEGHSEAAVAAALKQQERLAHLNGLWKDKGLPELKVRMGLARGRVLSGNLGSSKRMKYGLVGDSVNLASRLEGLCKRYGVASLVDDNVQCSCGVAERFFLRPIDLVTVKGRSQPTELFELVARRQHGSQSQRQQRPPGEPEPEEAAFCRLFGEAHALFRAGRFAETLVALDVYQGRWPADEPARLLRLRCEALLASPPGPDWSPVTHLTEKC